MWADDVDGERWAELKAAFATLIQLDPVERARRLEAVASDDPELARRLVDLLEADGRADSVVARFAPFLTHPDKDQPAGPAASTAAPDPLGLIGRRVAHFQIRDVLGGGGMGVLYRGEDTRLGRTVALKFLLPQYALDRSARERFLREGRAASALDHPNICTVYDVGETREGELFLAMACYEGETLSERLVRDGQLAIAEAVGIAKQVLLGLSVAHAAGIVHRDLKPGNLMLTPDGTVKILDFGLAKVRDLDLTEPGSRPGTVAYMSPEQLGGGPVDRRTDLWSLGVVLHEMLTGQPPFGRAHDLAALYSILHGDPAPPSNLRSGVGPSLDGIVGTLLCKVPDGRYGSADEVLAELEAASAWPDRGPGRSRETVSEVSGPSPSGDPTPPSAGRTLSTTEEPASIAVLPFRDLSGEPDQDYFGDGITEEIIGHLSKVEGLRVTARTSSFRFRDRSTDLREVGRQLGVSHVLDGSLHGSGDRLRISVELVATETGDRSWSERYERRRGDVFALQAEISRAIVESLRLHLAPEGESRVAQPPTASLDGYELFLRGWYFANKRTEVGLTRAIQYYGQAIAIDPGFARAHAGLADALVAPRDSGPGERFRLAREAALEALSLDGALAEAHTVMGWIKMWYDRDWAGAEWHFQRALRSNPGYLWAHQWYSAYLAAMGRLDEALTAIRRAHRIDPLSVTTITHIGSELFWLRRYEAAIDQFRKALALNPDFFMARWGLGRAFVHLGRHQEALREFESKGTDFVGFFQPSLLGHANAVAGWEGEARRILVGLGAAAERGVYVAPTEIAAIHIGLGEHDRALDWLEHHEADRGARIFLRVDPMFDPVRGHPRFVRLLGRIGLG